MQYIREKAFFNTEIECELNIPDSVKVIEKSALFDEIHPYQLKKVKIGRGLKSGMEEICLCHPKEMEISEENKTYKMKNQMAMSKSEKTIYRYVGTGKPVKLGKETRTIGYRAFYETKVKKVICKKGLKTIKDSAFESSKLKEIKLPKGLETFDDTPLKKIVIPKSVNKVEKYALGSTIAGAKGYEVKTNHRKYKKIKLKRIGIPKKIIKKVLQDKKAAKTFKYRIRAYKTNQKGKKIYTKWSEWGYCPAKREYSSGGRIRRYLFGK